MPVIANSVDVLAGAERAKPNPVYVGTDYCLRYLWVQVAACYVSRNLGSRSTTIWSKTFF